MPERSLTKNQAKAVLGISKTFKTILFFGAIRPNKGLDNLLYALPKIKAHIPDIKLLIAGEPCEDYRRYKIIIEKEGIQDKIFEKLEYITHYEVALYFSASDVVALPYNEVTQSGVLQIAYAFGKPVVASSIGGFNETIENGKNGYLVSPHNITALADKIREILLDEVKIAHTPPGNILLDLEEEQGTAV